MFKFLVIISSLISAIAFSPVNRVKVSSSLKMASFENEIGVQPPLGYWDPMGILDDGEQATFDHFRYCEVKHGRIAMLAVLGHLVTGAGIRLPGNIAYDLPYSSMKAGVAVFDTLPTAGFLQLFGFIGLLELGFNSRQEEIEKAQLKASKWDDATIRRKKAIELNNGRAAMMGIFGMVVHEKIDNNPYILNTLLGAPVHFN